MATILDRSAGPLYAQVRDSLLRRINLREIPPGAPLPTEEELQAAFGVSRSVVRQALGELSDRGLVVRQRGRGSIVTPEAEHHRRVTQAGGLRQQLASAGQELRTEVLSLTEADAPPHAVDQLGSAPTWFLERLRSVDDEPVVYMHAWVPRDLFPQLSAGALDGGSLLDYMRSTGVEPEGGPRHVEAVAAEGQVARQLGCAPGTPLLLLHGITRDAFGRGLEWFKAWHRPHTVFDIDARVDLGTGTGGDFTTPSATPAPDDDVAKARELLEEAAHLLQPQRRRR